MQTNNNKEVNMTATRTQQQSQTKIITVLGGGPNTGKHFGPEPGGASHYVLEVFKIPFEACSVELSIGAAKWKNLKIPQIRE